MKYIIRFIGILILVGTVVGVLVGMVFGITTLGMQSGGL
jgi:type III secretory pathway component EscS